MPGRVHMVAGGTGAGKTAYATRLASDERGMLFSVDQWMRVLFEPDRDGPPEYAWMMERIGRVEEMIWELVIQADEIGRPSILDLGFMEAAHRRAHRRRARRAGLRVHLHLIDLPHELRWERVQQRNAEKGPTFAMHVTREMFMFTDTLWERPEGNELGRYDAVTILND